jgi:hypothetical protein
MPKLSRFFYALIVTNIVFFGAVSGQDKTDTTSPAKEKIKKKKLKLEDAIYRAMLKAKDEEDEKVVRATVTPSESKFNEAFVVLVEFDTGDIGFFQGGLDSTEDQWIVCSKKELDLVEECAHRGARRGS